MAQACEIRPFSVALLASGTSTPPETASLSALAAASTSAWVASSLPATCSAQASALASACLVPSVQCELSVAFARSICIESSFVSAF